MKAVVERVGQTVAVSLEEIDISRDPELESRSAGQKILLRIGNDNAARIKAKLREIRTELTRRGPKS